jgi:hypothetical protein
MHGRYLAPQTGTHCDLDVALVHEFGDEHIHVLGGKNWRRLRQLRKSARPQTLADATSQHLTRISRIENGVQLPTEQNIRDWCAA